MTDIVERLRLMLACDPGCEGRCHDCPTSVASEAADEIERLRATLQRIANLETKWFPSKQDLLLEMIREAREVLNDSKL